MSYRIIGDSCSDLTPELMEDSNIALVPLTISLGEEEIVDDDTFDQREFVRKMNAYPGCPKSACPAPTAYMENFEGVDESYVVTLTSMLSGSYNSAETAKKQYLEEHPDAKIAVFDSKSASVGQLLIIMKIKECLKAGCSFHDVVEKVARFRDDMSTRFVLESLENLRKNGRLSNTKALVINMLNIKPIMMASKEGMIEKVSQARGFDKALVKMAELIAAEVKDAKDRVLAVSHCNNYEKAMDFVKHIQSLVTFKDTVLVETAGISSLYANDGGIIVSY